MQYEVRLWVEAKTPDSFQSVIPNKPVVGCYMNGLAPSGDGSCVWAKPIKNNSNNSSSNNNKHNYNNICKKGIDKNVNKQHRKAP